MTIFPLEMAQNCLKSLNYFGIFERIFWVFSKAKLSKFSILDHFQWKNGHNSIQQSWITIKNATFDISKKILVPVHLHPKTDKWDYLRSPIMKRKQGDSVFVVVVYVCLRRKEEAIILATILPNFVRGHSETTLRRGVRRGSTNCQLVSKLTLPGLRWCWY